MSSLDIPVSDRIRAALELRIVAMGYRESIEMYERFELALQAKRMREVADSLEGVADALDPQGVTSDPAVMARHRKELAQGDGRRPEEVRDER